MRTFYWENAGLPVEVGGQRYTFEVVSRVAGTIAGVLAVDDDAAAERLKTLGARLGIVEIDAATYAEHVAQKKSTPPALAGRVRPNSDPWQERQNLSARNPAVAAETATSNKDQVPGAKADAAAAANQATAMQGKGGAQTVQPLPDGGHEGSPQAQLPEVDELFSAARAGEAEAENAAARGKGQGGRGKGRKS